MAVATNAAGDYIDIDNVPSGLQVDCFCIGCKQALVAKKGESNRHHFAHHIQTNDHCSWSPETELHVQTKRVIIEDGNILTPIGIDNKKLQAVNYGDAKVEVRIEGADYIADAFAMMQGEPLYFEVLVTHASEKDKILFYKSIRANAIEIDMSNYFAFYSAITRSNIRQYMRDYALSHKWLSINPVGIIGELFYAHYIHAIAKIKRDISNHTDQLTQITQEVQTQKAAHLQLTRVLYKKELTQNNSINDLQNRIQSLQDHPLVEQERVLIETFNKREEAIERREVSLTNKEKYLAQSQSRLNARIGNFDAEMNEYKTKQLALFKQHLKGLKEQARQQWESDFTQQHKTLIDSENRDINLLEKRKSTLLQEVSAIQDVLDSIDEREKLIATTQEQARKAASAYSSASNHIRTLTDELRPLARKFGMPWPIDQQCIDTLEQAGKSNISDILMATKE
jgi:hypothetical protein